MLYLWLFLCLVVIYNEILSTISEHENAAMIV